MDETKQPAVKEMTPDELAEFQAHLNGVSNVIRVEGGSLPQNVAHAERALAAATRSDPERGIYQRGGVLVRIARLPRATVTDGIRRAAGTLQIMTAGSDFLRMKLTEAVAWERLDKRGKQFIPTDAPLAVARTLADCAGGWLSTPNLTGVIECPVLRPDGSILSRPG